MLLAAMKRRLPRLKSQTSPHLGAVAIGELEHRELPCSEVGALEMALLHSATVAVVAAAAAIPAAVVTAASGGGGGGGRRGVGGVAAAAAAAAAGSAAAGSAAACPPAVRNCTTRKPSAFPYAAAEARGLGQSVRLHTSHA